MDNLYQTPSAELIIEKRPRDMFFVTSLNKLFTLYFVTLGLYSIYWVYKQWDTQRAAMRPRRISPAARSIFQIFFIHSLCRLIAKQLQAKGLEEWKYASVAWTYIALIFVSNGLSRAGSHLGAPLELMLLLVGTILPAWPLSIIQTKANLVSGDTEGSSNSRFSIGNYLCMVPGVLLWLMVFIGYFL